MPQIVMEGACKTYEVAKRGAGLRGALMGAFKRERTYVKAVDQVSFSIERGELAGYIGPNGAGKSTTIKLMSGILTPDAGRVEVLGRMPGRQRRAHVKDIGVVFGQRCQLWWDTPVIDSFELLRDIYAVEDADYKRRLGELTERLDAGELLNTPVRQLSLGQRMRCELVAALLHGPKILFLDEPTIGLDAVSKLKLRVFLRELNQSGMTMILTTHDMDDIEALCSRVMVIGRGRLLFDGTMARLRESYAPTRIIKARLREDLASLELPGADEVALSGREARVTFRPERIAPDALIALLASRAPISDLTLEAPDVETIVADMYAELAL